VLVLVGSSHPVLCLCCALLLALLRYVGGNNSLLSRPMANERRFEGIRLETPGVNVPSGPLQHLQICQECYTLEATWVASGAKSRLPGGLSLTDLTQQVRGSSEPTGLVAAPSQQ